MFYKKEGLDANILYVLKPLDVYKCLSSNLIIASHGIFFHKLITKYLKIKTLYCGHAIEGAYPIEEDVAAEKFSSVGERPTGCGC